MEQDVKYGEYGKVTFINGWPQCHICGKTFKKLGAHSWKYHHIPTKSYREMFGICKKTRLICDESIELCRERNLENREVNLANLDAGKNKRYTKGDVRFTKKRKICKEHHDILTNLCVAMLKQRVVNSIKKRPLN